MFLAAYHFDGTPAELVGAYERLMGAFPPDSLDLHVCVIRDGGLSIYDACPSASVFADFSASEQFAGAVRAAGLPAPRVEPLGEVHAARMREGVGR
jgi:hypothetical protein